MNFSDDQKKVIEARNCNILVSAAAGSGKTAVLVERIIRLVLEGTDIDRLLVVTFTKAAAAEMRERITKALSEQLSMDPDNSHLQRQMTLIHNARITTIDSFNNYILRNNFNDIGLDPAFRTATTEEVKPILEEVLQTVFEEKYAVADPDFLDAVECFDAGGDDKGLAKEIRALASFAENEPFPEEWLREEIALCEGAFDRNAFEESIWGSAASAEISENLRHAKKALAAALALSEEPDGPEKYAPAFAEKLDLLESVSEDRPFFYYRDALKIDIAKKMPAQRATEGLDVSKKDRASALYARAKQIVEGLRKDFFTRDEAEFLEDMNRSRHLTKVLAELTLLYMQRGNEAKRAENLLTFSDIAHLALSVLVRKDESGAYRPTAAADDYRAFFKEIMIDEYQDSNLVQEIILSTISGECAPEGERFYNRFMVGDVKQSIYRFRQAKPRLFTEKYDTYTLNEGNCRKIILQKNFRSRAHVLRDINSVFEKCMHRGVGNVEYDAEARLNEGAEYPEATGLETECLLLAKDPESRDDASTQEARLIASRIRRLMHEGRVYDKNEKTMRAVRFSDITILSRNNAGWFTVLRDVLKEYGIPAHTISAEGYFSAEEIRTLMNTLKVLDNPRQDIPLFGVMHSVIGGFTEEELAMIRASRKACMLYDALCEAAAPETGAFGLGRISRELSTKCAAFLDLIQRYRKKTSYTPLRRLLQELLTETGYREYQAAFPEGEQRVANIDMLLQKAGEFEKNGAYGLFKFIRYIDQLSRFEIDSGEANTADENANVVRLMTIHKSKGLEFPICFITKMDKAFNKNDEKGSFLLDETLGVGCDAIYPDRRLERTTIVHNLIKRQLNREMLGEELRLLYVAMTRAKEKLIMTACVANPEKTVADSMAGYDPATDRLLDAYLLGCKHYLAFVLPAWERVTILQSGDLEEAGLQESVDLALRKNALLTGTAGRADAALAAKWRERFAFRYPHEDLRDLFTKTTVSELKIQKLEEENEGVLRLFDSESRDAYVPRFARTQEAVSGSAYGSAMHLAMEKMDFTDPDDRHAARMAAEAAEPFVSEEGERGSVRTVNITKIMKFLSSDVASRMKAAAAKGQLFREKPFMLGLPASEVKPGFPDGEVILIQGIIDAYWEEEDGFVILDYKTDHIKELEELPARYRTQIDYYARALSEITGKPVKERLLYSFCLDNAVKC
ncbi:MAG: helicase-exonuclease AddAB subunit AddA [Lachnospiraceae bacterium]|nr:helicase-exonuclease AddAB subunit AddA [Lachnospiraceae bacterium]